LPKIIINNSHVTDTMHLNTYFECILV
jgi:hypothetical protein